MYLIVKVFDRRQLIFEISSPYSVKRYKIVFRFLFVEKWTNDVFMS